MTNINNQDTQITTTTLPIYGDPVRCKGNQEPNTEEESRQCIEHNLDLQEGIVIKAQYYEEEKLWHIVARDSNPKEECGYEWWELYCGEHLPCLNEGYYWQTGDKVAFAVKVHKPQPTFKVVEGAKNLDGVIEVEPMITYRAYRIPEMYKELKAFCEEHDWDFLGVQEGSRRAWIRSMSTYLRDYNALVIDEDGNRSLQYVDWDAVQ